MPSYCVYIDHDDVTPSSPNVMPAWVVVTSVFVIVIDPYTSGPGPDPAIPLEVDVIPVDGRIQSVLFRVSDMTITGINQTAEISEFGPSLLPPVGNQSTECSLSFNLGNSPPTGQALIGIVYEHATEPPDLV